jgi:hypothetical protein
MIKPIPSSGYKAILANIIPDTAPDAPIAL